MPEKIIIFQRHDQQAEEVPGREVLMYFVKNWFEVNNNLFSFDQIYSLVSLHIHILNIRFLSFNKI